jgi:hypothetical protein
MRGRSAEIEGGKRVRKSEAVLQVLQVLPLKGTLPTVKSEAVLDDGGVPPSTPISRVFIQATS